MLSSEARARTAQTLERSTFTGPTRRYGGGGRRQSARSEEMFAKYDGKCRTCGGALYAGEVIRWSPEAGARHQTAEQCDEVRALAADPDFQPCGRCHALLIEHFDNECPDGAGTFTTEAPVVAPVEDSLSEAVRDGTFTAVAADGSYATVKISTCSATSALAGRRIVSYLSGSDNETSFCGFGFFEAGAVKVWSRFRGSAAIQRYVEAVKVVVGDPSAAGFLYAQQSGRCCVCNRKLTVPSSIDASMGPDCAAKAWAA